VSWPNVLIRSLSGQSPSGFGDFEWLILWSKQASCNWEPSPFCYQGLGAFLDATHSSSSRWREEIVIRAKQGLLWLLVSKVETYGEVR
jgi:hypothetical protein